MTILFLTITVTPISVHAHYTSSEGVGYGHKTYQDKPGENRGALAQVRLHLVLLLTDG